VQRRTEGRGSHAAVRRLRARHEQARRRVQELDDADARDNVGERAHLRRRGAHGAADGRDGRGVHRHRRALAPQLHAYSAGPSRAGVHAHRLHPWLLQLLVRAGVEDGYARSCAWVLIVCLWVWADSDAAQMVVSSDDHEFGRSCTKMVAVISGPRLSRLGDGGTTVAAGSDPKLVWLLSFPTDSEKDVFMGCISQIVGRIKSERVLCAGRSGCLAHVVVPCCAP
jgi:hypothetical protein